MGLFDRLRKTGQSLGEENRSQVMKDGQDAGNLLEEGMALEQEGRLEEALQRYEAAICLNPALARAHFNRGNILLDRGDAQSALDAYAQAIQYKPDSAAAHYNMGNAHLRLGHPETALSAYRQALALKPDFADAEVALGRSLDELGQPEEAIASCRRALTIKPDYPEVHYSLANLLKGLGQFDAAAASYRRVIEIQPDHAEAHGNLGMMLQHFGQLDEAAATYRRALELKPDFFEAHGNLGNVLRELGQFDEAVASYHRVLEIQPESAEAHNNLGNALKDLGQLDEALVCYHRALEVRPDFAVAYYNAGVCLQKSGMLDQALVSYRQALAFRPEYVEAHVNLGAVLREVGQLDHAATSCRRALEINPGNAEAHLVLGNVLQDLGQVGEAIANYYRALVIRPDYVDAHNNLGAALTVLGQLDEAVESYRRALERQPDNADAHMNLGSALTDLGLFDVALASARRALEICPNHALAFSNLLFIHNYLGDQPGALMLAEARRYGELVTRLARPYTDWPNSANPDRCLRIGLVSGDLREHPVGYFVEGILAALSSSAVGRLALFAYSNHAVDDATSRRMQSCCRGWHFAVGVSDAALAKRIRDDGIDILIDLSGHTAFNRLPVFAWKPAPVQASWIGYFATTGVAEVDYFIADPWTLLPSEEANFTEQVWRLPETRLCFTPPDADVDISPLPAYKKGYLTFGCFNNLSKMNDSVVALWARVLVSLPHSRLLLKSRQIRELSVRENIAERFAAHGISADRLILEGYVPRSKYLAAYQQVDIALDPFPYPGGTTTVEALWMGVPVLTLMGERFLSRQGVGLLMNAGLSDWIASDADDYVARAVAHASDLQGLAVLRGGLRQQVLASPVFDAAGFAKHFEVALRGMWAKWCDQNAGCS